MKSIYTPDSYLCLQIFIPDRIYDSFCYPNDEELVKEKLYNSLGNLPKAMGINSLANLSCMCASGKVKVKPKRYCESCGVDATLASLLFLTGK